MVFVGKKNDKPYQNIIGQVAQGAGELHKKLLVKPPNKLDEEAGIQAKSVQKVQSWMAKK